MWSSLIGLTGGTTLVDWSESEATICPDLSCFCSRGKARRQLIIVSGLLRLANWFSLKCVDESAVGNGIKRRSASAWLPPLLHLLLFKFNLDAPAEQDKEVVPLGRSAILQPHD